MKIVEIEDTFDATLTHYLPFDSIATDVRVEHRVAYIAAGVDGLIVIGIQNANRPEMILRLLTPEPAWGVEIYAYVSAGELISVDVRVPNQVRVAARRHMPGSAYRIALSDGWAYVAALDGGLQTFDITAPENPRAIGSYDSKGNATSITLVGERAYVLDNLVGVQVLNIADPQRPVSIAEYPTDALPLDVQIRDDRLYLLDQQGVQIVDTRDFELVSRFRKLCFPSGWVVIGEGVYVTDLYELRIFKIQRTTL